MQWNIAKALADAQGLDDREEVGLFAGTNNANNEVTI